MYANKHRFNVYQFSFEILHSAAEQNLMFQKEKIILVLL